MRGFSLLEVTVVMTIVIIVSAIAIPQVTQLWYDTQLRSSAAEVASLMQQARISAARSNATYPVRFGTNNGIQQVYIDLNNNSSLDTNEPYIDLPGTITAAAGAPSGSNGQPGAYLLVGDSSTGTPFDNSNVLAYSPRGLPCNYIGSTSTCTTPALSYFVFYFQSSGNHGWSAVLVTKSGRTKALMWNGAQWK
jgi:prepilin-type N-terminal cleavage/methylation domain-containing protein